MSSIQVPLSSSATPTPTTFGTNARVNSWIWVADWNSETANPMTSAVSSVGRGELGRDQHRLHADMDDLGVSHGP